jgi:hypothetical protein
VHGDEVGVDYLRMTAVPDLDRDGLTMADDVSKIWPWCRGINRTSTTY